MGTLGDTSFPLRYNGTMLCSDPVCSDWSHPCWFTSHITYLGILVSTDRRNGSQPDLSYQGGAVLTLVQLVGAPTRSNALREKF